MRQFGDWRLAALAYNAGPNRVARGLRGLPEAGERVPRGARTPLHRLPQSDCCTRLRTGRPGQFFPKALQLDFEPLTIVERPAFAYSTTLIARAAGIELQALLDYNAGASPGRCRRQCASGAAAADWCCGPPWPGRRRAGNAPTLRPAPRGEPTYVVSVGDTLWQIARRYGVALGDLLRWNKISRTRSSDRAMCCGSRRSHRPTSDGSRPTDCCGAPPSGRSARNC